MNKTLEMDNSLKNTKNVVNKVMKKIYHANTNLEKDTKTLIRDKLDYEAITLTGIKRVK